MDNHVIDRERARRRGLQKNVKIESINQQICQPDDGSSGRLIPRGCASAKHLTNIITGIPPLFRFHDHFHAPGPRRLPENVVIALALIRVGG